MDTNIICDEEDAEPRHEGIECVYCGKTIDKDGHGTSTPEGSVHNPRARNSLHCASKLYQPSKEPNMARETVMIELDESVVCGNGKPATPAQEAEFIREKLAGTAMACIVRTAPIPNADRVLVDVEDPSRDIVDLVTDKLNDAGVSAFVYHFDNETNAIAE